eukprot:220294-Chlamydomonas_euryale.AAC.3
MNCAPQLRGLGTDPMQFWQQVRADGGITPTTFATPPSLQHGTFRPCAAPPIQWPYDPLLARLLCPSSRPSTHAGPAARAATLAVSTPISWECGAFTLFLQPCTHRSWPGCKSWMRWSPMDQFVGSNQWSVQIDQSCLLGAMEGRRTSINYRRDTRKRGWT